MKLTIIPEGPLSFDGKNYLYSEGEGLYIDGLAKYFEEVVICAYAFHKGDAWYEATSHYHFKSSNIKFIELPLCRSNSGIFSKLIQMIKVSKTILMNIKSWDVLYLFLPGFPSAIAFLINKLYKKKYFLYLASDWQEEAALLFPWEGLKRKFFYFFFYKFTGWIERKSVEGALLVLIAGKAIYQKYQNYVVPIYETIPRINWAEMTLFFRKDTCQSVFVGLLFVGYLIPRKGVKFLIEAVSIIEKRKKHRVLLKIVGQGPQKEELEYLVNELGLSDRVKFFGHLPNGPELFAIYRESDIFIMPSFSGEGFPRVLYEAMSQSIPIVTTDVCGISTKMKDRENAILIPPESPEAIAKAIEKLIIDGDLRRKLIKNGQKFMQTMLANYTDNQVHILLKKHFPEYRQWIKTVQS